MDLPFFYFADLSHPSLILDEATSKHVVQVLRMKKNDELILTNGKGDNYRVIIIDDHKKRCEVNVLRKETIPQAKPVICIAISLLKNTARFEWFLEKATELGVQEIVPLICERTSKDRYRNERFQNILISAMLQSKQSWLPVLYPPMDFENVLKMDFALKMIAHCLPLKKSGLIKPSAGQFDKTIILVGPEGDFTEKEIARALAEKFQPVTLGNTRLRTETAGIVAAAILTSNAFDHQQAESSSV
jgi:16S rRNA (uracil1498-N3)-methyltransferase